VALWLEAIAAGGSYSQLSQALSYASHKLGALRPTTLALVQAFFE
jgi:hypothetical protein